MSLYYVLDTKPLHKPFIKSEILFSSKAILLFSSSKFLLVLGYLFYIY